MSGVVEKQEQAGKGLQSGALGLWGNVTIGLASTAPAYSLAATLGYVVLTVGDRAPAMFLLAFVPMLLVAVAYRELNRAMPDCGTTFTWGTKALGPWVGWMGGWGVAVRRSSCWPTSLRSPAPACCCSSAPTAWPRTRSYGSGSESCSSW
ncbi:MAG TPA: hypothetical protein VK401_01045 [Propionibacteriaceae bacterium]|nr:hypothetical protein [Propionibacteriaceae bacterium]